MCPRHHAGLTLAHVLRDDVDGLLRHHRVQLHQLLMPQFLHDLGLLKEGLRRHRAGLQSFDGHPGGAIPGPCMERGAGCLRGGPPFSPHRDQDLPAWVPISALASQAT